MPRELGFMETGGLLDTRKTMREAVRTGNLDEIEEFRLLYKMFAEHACDDLEGEAYLNAQVGRVIAEASLYFESGDIESYLVDIRLAIELLGDAGLSEKAEALTDSVNEYYRVI